MCSSDLSIGKTVITMAQLSMAYAMANNLGEIDELDEMLSPALGLVEAAIQWTDKVTGVPCKCRMDYCLPDLDIPVVLDLKTTRDASPKAFGRSVYEFGYHVQAAMYSDALEAVTGKTPMFLFFCVENTPPHHTAKYFLDDQALWMGQDKYRDLLKKYQECVESGEWPGYSDEFVQLSLPRWAEF